MSSYLPDTNIICALASPKHSNHVKAMAKMRSLTPERVFLPLIAIAEIRFGLASVDNADQSQRAELENFLLTYPSPYGFDDGTVEPYSLLRAQLFRNWATRDKRGRSFVEKQAWELADQVTGKGALFTRWSFPLLRGDRLRRGQNSYKACSDSTWKKQFNRRKRKDRRETMGS
jgi:predicted nucleic acid-binding protein